MRIYGEKQAFEVPEGYDLRSPGAVAELTKRLHGIACLLDETNSQFHNIATRLLGSYPQAGCAQATATDAQPVMGELEELSAAISRVERAAGESSDFVGRFSRI